MRWKLASVPVVVAVSFGLAACGGGGKTSSNSDKNPDQPPHGVSCTPDCAGRECGNDGCGGDCGACPGGKTCDADGACVNPLCEPSCAGAACGDSDGCDGNCDGSCDPGYACRDGLCEPICVSDCTGVDCGAPNGCGGFCTTGNCPDGEYCDNGVCRVKPCIPDCTGVDCGAADGCGGVCPTGYCGHEEYCDAGVCKPDIVPCEPSCDAETACGASDGCNGICLAGTCPGGQHCDAGVCKPDIVPCEPSCDAETACGASDGCGDICLAGTCPGGQHCDAGVCKPDIVPCRPSCGAETACGANDGCGGVCPSGVCPDGEHCEVGSCVPDECVPSCAERTCGGDPDGCGGVCPGCGDGMRCGSNSLCVPVAWGTTDMGCRDAWYGAQDGCDCACGAHDLDCGVNPKVVYNCPDGMYDEIGLFQGTCNNGVCVCLAEDGCACEPDCAGRVCGPDGCGGLCGDTTIQCGDGGRCAETGTCVPVAWGGACPDSWYAASDGCDCGCGAHDLDCDANPIPVNCPYGMYEFTRDDDGTVRIAAFYGACEGDNGGECVCPEGTPNCCVPLDCAALGLACGDDWCGGSCGTCSAGQTCNRQRECVTVPEGWGSRYPCPLELIGDGECHCECGAVDPDCVPGEPGPFCPSTALTCNEQALCVPGDWICDSATYGAEDGCHCGCGAYDPDCWNAEQILLNCPDEATACSAAAECVTIPSAWGTTANTCPDTWYGEGWCDCECGAYDPDCDAPSHGQIFNCPVGTASCSPEGTCVPLE